MCTPVGRADCENPFSAPSWLEGGPLHRDRTEHANCIWPLFQPDCPYIADSWPETEAAGAAGVRAVGLQQEITGC